MNKTIRTFKIAMITGFLLLSIFAVLIPSVTAGPLGLTNCNALLRVEPEDPNDLRQKIQPLSGPMIVPIKVGYLVTGIFSEPTIRRFTNTVPAQIKLTIEDTSQWVTATVQPNIISPQITEGWSFDTAILSISFRKDIPAREEVKVTIKMESNEISAILWKINAATGSGDLTITPEYLPIIDATPKTTYKEIAPGEIAEFEIILENLGNAETEFVFETLQVPEGWGASIVAATKVGSSVEGENPTKTVVLQVQPPYGFGYHDEREQMKLKIRGQYFAGVGNETLLSTDWYTHTFTVRSRGFSTPGFEVAFVLVALGAILVIYKKRQKKQK